MMTRSTYSDDDLRHRKEKTFPPPLFFSAGGLSAWVTYFFRVFFFADMMEIFAAGSRVGNACVLCCAEQQPCNDEVDAVDTHL